MQAGKSPPFSEDIIALVIWSNHTWRLTELFCSDQSIPFDTESNLFFESFWCSVDACHHLEILDVPEVMQLLARTFATIRRPWRWRFFSRVKMAETIKVFLWNPDAYFLLTTGWDEPDGLYPWYTCFVIVHTILNVSRAGRVTREFFMICFPLHSPMIWVLSGKATLQDILRGDTAVFLLDDVACKSLLAKWGSFETATD